MNFKLDPMTPEELFRRNGFLAELERVGLINDAHRSDLLRELLDEYMESWDKPRNKDSSKQEGE